MSSNNLNLNNREIKSSKKVTIIMVRSSLLRANLVSSVNLVSVLRIMQNLRKYT